MRFRIAGKIWLSLTVLLAGYLLTTGVVFFSGLRTERRLDALAGSAFQAAQLSQAAVADFDAQTQAYETAVVTGVLELLDTAEENAGKAERSLDAIGTLGGRGAAEARETASELRAYSKAGGDLYRKLASNAAGPDAAARAGEMFRRAQALRGRLAALSRVSSSRLQKDLINLASASKTGRRFLVGIMATVLLVSVASVSWATRCFISRPAADLAASLRGIAAGGADLTRRLRVASDDEVGELACGFNEFVGRLSLMVGRLKALSTSFTGVAHQIGASSREVSAGAVNQASLLVSSSSAVQRIQASIDGIASSTAELFEDSIRSSSATQQMSATNESIAAQMDHLFSRVDEVSVSVDELSAATQQIVAFISHVEVSAAHAAEAVASLDRRVASIRASADAASRFSEEAAKNAEIGKQAVDSTISGVAALQAMGALSADVIADLGNRADAIGSVLGVIDEVAEQTNLLALNAAILAAQAGERGRGFAVVAEEIRDLAERTESSTQEIGSIIDGLQRAAKEAVETMSAGHERVVREAELAREAGSALEKIHAGAFESLEQSRRIARETTEQEHGSREAKAAVDQIALMIKEVTLGASQQRDSAEVASQSARTVRDIAAAVKNSTAEQVLASTEIAERLDRARLMIERINEATQEQARRSHDLLEATFQTQQIAEATSQKAAHMERVVEVLTLESTALAGEIGAFRT